MEIRATPRYRKFGRFLMAPMRINRAVFGILVIALFASWVVLMILFYINQNLLSVNQMMIREQAEMLAEQRKLVEENKNDIETNRSMIEKNEDTIEFHFPTYPPPFE